MYKSIACTSQAAGPQESSLILTSINQSIDTFTKKTSTQADSWGNEALNSLETDMQVHSLHRYLCT